MSVISALTWVVWLISASVSKRKKAKEYAIDHLLHFNKGEVTEESEKMVESLLNDYKFVGFTPNVMYVKETGSEEELMAQWVHPFSVPTLLFKHKKLPILVMANGNLDFNDSRLRKIDSNISLTELKSILGITG